MLFRKSKKEDDIIAKCVKGKPLAQKQLYELYFNYAMSVAMRYAANGDEALEITNDAFLKAFSSISRFDPELPFKGWFRQIIIHTAIDQYRKYAKRARESEDILYVHEPVEPEVFAHLANEDILKCIQQLPKSYRTVFVLYVVEGYKHHEIAAMLGISEGTSKSNLAVAREKLRNLLGKSTANYRNHG